MHEAGGSAAGDFEQLRRAEGLAIVAATWMLTAHLAAVPYAWAGLGPIDALFKAINRTTGVSAKVVDYRVRSVTQDMDAMGEAQVEIDHNGKRLRARAVSVDVIEASALAYLEVLNRVASRQVRDRLKPTDNVRTEMVPTVA